MRAGGAQSKTEIEVWVSFDIEHDEELYERLLEQSRAPGCRFVVSGGSERFTDADVWSERVRRRIRRADQVIIICGEHTEDSQGVFTELRIAQEEETPYFLLWGRRDAMCTKPLGANSSEGMYSWTSEILEDQIALTARCAHHDKLARETKRPAATPGLPVDSPALP